MAAPARNRLASRKLVAGVVAIAAIGLNQRLGLGITEQGIEAIVSIAVTLIGGQAGIDALADLRPMVMDWLAYRVMGERAVLKTEGAE